MRSSGSLSDTLKSARPQTLSAPSAAPSWRKSFDDVLRPGPRVWMGAIVGAIAASVTLLSLLATSFPTGLGTGANTLLGVGLGLAAIGLLRLVINAATAALRPVPHSVLSAVLSAMLAVLLFPLLSGQFNPLLVFFTLVILLEALTGMSFTALLGQEFSEAKAGKRAAIALFAALTLAANAVMFSWVTGDGSDAHLTQVQATATVPVPPIAAPNPGLAGPYPVRRLTYGSGTPSTRPEFGAQASFKTAPVDASLLLPSWHGLTAAARRWYWGFDASQLPLNASVWLPGGAGPFPLVLLVHGNHSMELPSDTGYGYLAETLASRGYIVAAVDENFLNSSWSGDLGGKEIPARAWLLLQHLACWRTWNQTPGHPFYQQVALDKIALVGHSRGGEAIAVAALFNQLSHYPENARLKFDFHFGIKTLIALAPSADFYEPAGHPVTLNNLDYLVLHGGHDSDVAAFMGSRQYQRIKFSDDDFHFKAAVYLYRANHAQFNTAWGSNDWGEPFGSLLNRKPLLSAAEQQDITRVYLNGFLDASLRAQRAYLPLFRDQRSAPGWLPAGIYLSRFTDSAFKVVSHCEEDLDPATTSIPGGLATAEGMQIWREEKLPLRLDLPSQQTDNVVRLDWAAAPASAPAATPVTYALQLPAGLAQVWQLDEQSQLRFALANASSQAQPVAVSIELSSSTGASVRLPLERFANLTPPLTIRFSKLAALDHWVLRPAELVPQTFTLPLADFCAANAHFDPRQLERITFHFQHAQPGSVLLDDIGFSLQTP